MWSAVLPHTGPDQMCPLLYPIPEAGGPVTAHHARVGTDTRPQQGPATRPLHVWTLARTAGSHPAHVLENLPEFVSQADRVWLPLHKFQSSMSFRIIGFHKILLHYFLM